MKLKRSHALVVLAGLGVAGLVGASAASLGEGETDQLGAATDVVASCDSNGVDVAFTTTFVAGDYEVSAVDLSDVAVECDGQAIDVTLTGADDADLGSGSGVADDSGEATIAIAGSVDAELVTGVAIVISG